MASDDKVARWDSFTDMEKAYLCLTICGTLMRTVAENIMEGGDAEPVKDRQVLDEVIMGTELVSQINESTGGDAVDRDLLIRMQAMREMLTEKIEARGGEA